MNEFSCACVKHQMHYPVHAGNLENQIIFLIKMTSIDAVYDTHGVRTLFRSISQVFYAKGDKSPSPTATRAATIKELPVMVSNYYQKHPIIIIQNVIY